MSENNLLEIKNLTVSFKFNKKQYPVIRGVSFDVRKNEILGIVGESGSGKSVTSKTILKLIPEPPGNVDSGIISVTSEVRHIRRACTSKITQELVPSTRALPCRSLIRKSLR